MPFRIAMLALALAAAGAASAQTGAGDPRSADADLDRTVVEADVIEGVSDLEVTARGNAEINRDDLSIFGDLLRYNRELGAPRAMAACGCGAAPTASSGRACTTTLRRHGRVRDSGVSPAGRPHRTRQRRAPGIPRARALPHDQRERIPPASPDQEDWRLEAKELDLDFEGEDGEAVTPRLRFFDTTILASPWAMFPLGDRRRSGILTPYYAQTSTRGFEFGIALLLEHRPRVRRDLHAGVHGEARRPAQDPGPLPRPNLRRRGQVRVSARRQGIRRFARRRVVAAHAPIPAQHGRC